ASRLVASRKGYSRSETALQGRATEHQPDAMVRIAVRAQSTTTRLSHHWPLTGIHVVASIPPTASTAIVVAQTCTTKDPCPCPLWVTSGHPVAPTHFR